MAWVIQSVMEGPVCLDDIGINLTKGQFRDLDLIGRENAERSNAVKLALAKCWIRTVKKDASTSGGGGVSPEVVEAITDATSKINEATSANTELVRRLEERNKELERQLEEQRKRFDEQLAEQRQHNDNVVANANKVLDEVRSFSEKFPLEIRTIGEAMRNIQVERANVAEEKSSLAALAASGHSEAEIKAQEKILSLKDKKLEKNFKELGKTVSASATDVNDALDALDELGI